MSMHCNKNCFTYIRKIDYNLHLIALSPESRLDIPAGRVVRRAGSSSRKSGARRRATAGLAGANASSTSSASAGSILLPAPTTCSPTCFQTVPATSSLFSLRALFSFGYLMQCLFERRLARGDRSAQIVYVNSVRRRSRTEASEEQFPSSYG
ncbi:unnamed protein product [Euphydryas editha]|uniref:Uncharacterized protein n=1 Tax=Euphydryas editha TaxID=104508 RepID=A0AAU9UHB8_EUPED|nr:unnamed protein product [Euphydryas editha]